MENSESQEDKSCRDKFLVIVTQCAVSVLLCFPNWKAREKINDDGMGARKVAAGQLATICTAVDNLSIQLH